MKIEHLIVSAVCVAGALVTFSGCTHESATAQETTVAAVAPKIEGETITIPADAPQASALVIEAAEPRKSAAASFTGRLIWNDDSTVRIFSPVAGRVNAVIAKLGQNVSENDSLVKIASPDFGQAQTDARTAVVNSQQAERTLNRTKELFDHGAAAQKDLESAEADYTRAISEKQRTAARLSLYGGESTNIDQMFCLKSPIAGTVVEKNISPGMEVRPDAMMSNVPQYAQPLFVVSDPASLWLQLDVNESDISLLRAGQQIRVRSQAFPRKIFEGHIEVLGDSLDPNTRTVKARAVVDNSEKLLKAEMYVVAELALDAADKEKSGADVSAKAVFLKDNKHFIFFEDQPGKFERREVKVGGEANGKAFIQEGLTPGQRVVTEGSLLLEALLDGDKS